MSEHPIEKGVTDVVRTYELLDRVRTRQDLVIRDDQFDFTALLEAARYADRRRIRLSLLDTGTVRPRGGRVARPGRLPHPHLGRSPAAGRRVGDPAGSLPGSRDTSLRVLERPSPGRRMRSAGFSSQTLEDLLRSGVDFHISNRKHPRDAAALTGLAAAAKKGGAFFVIYHIGPLVAELAEPAAGRAWIHFSDTSIADEPAAVLAVEIARAAAGSGSRVAVHIERGLPLELLEELWAAGAVLLFLTPPSDDRSLLRPVETKAARRKLPARAYWLSTAFMP